MNQMAAVVDSTEATATDRSIPDERDLPGDASAAADDNDEFVGDEEAGSEPADAPAAPRSRVTGKGDLVRNVVLVKVGEISPALLDDLVDARRAAGVVIVLPRNMSATADLARRLYALERHMVQREFLTPIYFSFEDDEMQTILNTLATADLGGDRYQVSVSANEATSMTAPTLFNLQGWLHRSGTGQVDLDQVPTIAIVASYDSFAASPELAFGVDSSASGTIALLAIAKIFSRLYSDLRTHGVSQILFILTGGGRLNHLGAKHWLSQADPRVLEQLELVVCLEALAGGSNLFLHTSKPAKAEAVQSVYNAFRDTAKTMNIPYAQLQHKINVSSQSVHWPHERFGRRKLFAVTLSSSKHSLPMLNPGLLDDRSHANVKILQRNIKFVAEVLARLVYPAVTRTAKNLSDRVVDAVVFTPEADAVFVEAWLTFLGSQPRVGPYLTKTSEVVTALEQSLQSYASDVQRTSFALDSEFVFYQSSPTQATIFKVKPVVFEFYVLAAVAAYLGALHLYVKYDSLADVVKLFKRK